jgi:hypothetical protein
VDQQNYRLPLPDGYEWAERESITEEDGKVIWAKDCGMRYFLVLVPLPPTP